MPITALMLLTDIRRQWSRCATLVLFAVMSIPGRAAAGEPAILRFGVVPQQSATRLAKLWTPVLNYLAQRSGLHIRFATAPDIPDFEDHLAQGDYDLAYMNPYHYTVFGAAPGYRALAKASNKRIKGIIVVPRDSAHEALADLAGLDLAFPSPAAFAASILPRAELRRREIPFNAHYVSSHDSVYLNVAAGRFPAGGGVMRTLNGTPASVREKLGILWTTEGYTPHAIAAHPRVPNAARRRLVDAMDRMADDPIGKKLLQTLRIADLEPAHHEDWQDVRALNIGPLKPAAQD